MRRATLTVSIAMLLAGRALAAPAELRDSKRVLLAFEEPLVRSAPTTSAENEALFRAIRNWQGQAAPDDLAIFDRFLATYPRSGWRVALMTNLGLSYYHYGYFSRAIDSWEQAWQAGRSVEDLQVRALVDRAVGELVRMHARLGHADRIETLLAEIGDRPITGAATEAVQGAREGLWTMRNDPGTAYLCGPMALKNLLLARGATQQQVEFLNAVRSGTHGVSLAQLAGLAENAKLGYRLIFRKPGQPIPVPAIVHWKVTHFAALVEQADGRYHLQDPTFGQDLWISRAALESESSGYFLVPDTQSNPAWRRVSAAEAAGVRGMGTTGSNLQTAVTPQDPTAQDNTSPPVVTPPDVPTVTGQGCPASASPSSSSPSSAQVTSLCGCGGMCDYAFAEMTVSLRIKDTPVGYTPPRGPDVHVSLVYNQREASQPAIFTYSNVSPKWTLNWLTYIQDDPNIAGVNVMRYVSGGGAVNYTGYDRTSGAFAREARAGAQLVRTATAPITYERRLSDGSREVYAQSNGATAYPRKVFLTQLIDPLGNTVSLHYDSQFRLFALVDALQRTTSFSYDLPGQPLLITRITDPFKRSAQLSYDTKGRLIQITDVIGLTSSFTYDASSLINSLTTAYGTTQFSYGGTGNERFLQASDPLGNTERLEYVQGVAAIPFSDAPQTVPKGIVLPFNQYLNSRDTYYWDKHANAVAHGDYTKARIRHWTHWAFNTDVTADTIESIKNPLEHRVWMNYPGQEKNALGTGISGTLDNPTNIGRVLDDGSTQLAQFQYNTSGNATSAIDPLGRETQFVYDANGIDLLQVKRKTSASGYSTIAQYTYNKQHQALTYIDAAGQTTTYVYAVTGQLAQVIDPMGQTMSFQYDPYGYLTQIVDANNKVLVSFTYDALGHVASRTDSEGYTVSYTYDSLDRVTQETYPDGTTRQYTWNRLDLASVKDRQGRTTQYTHDAVRRLTAIADALGRQTKLGYDEAGRLTSLTDPAGNITSWTLDIQGRPVAKIYADGSKETYTYENTSGRLLSVTDPLGQVKQFAWTLDNQLAAIDYGNAVNPTAEVRFSYDQYYGQLATMTDGSGMTQYAYVPAGIPGALKLQQETGPFQNSTISYQYDALGRVTSRTVDSSTETFSYDSLSRLISHAGDLGTFDLTYLGETGQRTGRQLRGGPLATTWTYDTNANDRRLKAIAYSGAARGYQYTTTPEHLITQIAESATATPAWPVQTWSYTYDDANRLLNGSSSTGNQYVYGYDNADNMSGQQGPGIAAGTTVDALNQIAAFNGQAFAYDANGNLLSDGVRTYSWDAENRLLSIGYTAQPAWSTNFRYDGMGRRIAIVTTNDSGTTETRYLWCGERICQARDATDTVTRRYYPEGELAVAAATPLYFAKDHLGSVRDILAADGSNLASFDYDAYGNLIQSAGSVSPDFRYAGMLYDQSSGLYLTHYRAYDPATARWLSRDPLEENSANVFRSSAREPFRADPLGHGLNLFRYAANNPVLLKDPIGLCEEPECYLLLDDDQDVYKRASRIPGLPGAVTIVSHGNPQQLGTRANADGTLDPQAIIFEPKDIARLVDQTHTPKSYPVYIIACEAGKTGPNGEASLAQQVAKLTGRTVIASKCIVDLTAPGIFDLYAKAPDGSDCFQSFSPNK